MTTITVPRQLLEQALDAVLELEYSSTTAVADGKAREAKRALRAALAQQAEPSGWRPISTAPKDAIILLGFTPNPRMTRRVYEGRWNEEQQTWTSVNGFLIHSDATHWQPLPAAPKESSNG